MSMRAANRLANDKLQEMYMETLSRQCFPGCYHTVLAEFGLPPQASLPPNPYLMACLPPEGDIDVASRAAAHQLLQARSNALSEGQFLGLHEQQPIVLPQAFSPQLLHPLSPKPPVSRPRHQLSPDAQQQQLPFVVSQVQRPVQESPVLSITNSRLGHRTAAKSSRGVAALGGVSHRQAGKQPGVFPDLLCEGPQGLLNMVRTQAGCRAAQSYLLRHPERLSLIFNVFLPVAAEMAVDQFGNYFAQEIVARLDADQMALFFRRLLRGSLEFICMTHGTHVIQAAISRVASLVQRARRRDDEQERLAAEIAMLTLWRALGPLIPSLMQDATGGYVVKRCIEQFQPPDSNFVYEGIQPHAVELAMHRHGCCVLQRTLGLGTPHQQRLVVEPLVKQALRLAQHPFGNYVLQHAVGLELDSVSDDIARILVPHAIALSQQKSASNVIECLMRRGTPNTRNAVIDAINAGGKQQMLKMLRDRYANYVVRTACILAEGERQAALHANIREVVPALRSCKAGRWILPRFLRKTLIENPYSELAEVMTETDSKHLRSNSDGTMTTTDNESSDCGAVATTATAAQIVAESLTMDAATDNEAVKLAEMSFLAAIEHLLRDTQPEERTNAMHTSDIRTRLGTVSLPNGISH